MAVPSEKPQDLKFNAGKIDEFVTSQASQYIDRLGGKHYTIEGLKQLVLQQIYNLGWNPVGTFQDGATITTAGDIIQDESTGVWYRWDDLTTLPKTVPAGSTPDSTGGVGEGKWLAVDVSDVLRKDLAKSTGASLVGYGDETVADALDGINELISSQLAIEFENLASAQFADLSKYNIIAIRYKYSNVSYVRTGVIGVPSTGNVIRFYDIFGSEFKIIPEKNINGDVTCFTQMFVHDPSYFMYAKGLGIGTFINYIFPGDSLTIQFPIFFELCKLYDVSLILGIAGFEDQIPTYLSQVSSYFSDDAVVGIYCFDEPDTKSYATLTYQDQVIDAVKALTSKPISAALTADVNAAKKLDYRVDVIYISVYRQFHTFNEIKYYIANLIGPMEEGATREGRCVPILQTFNQHTGTNLNPTVDEIKSSNRGWLSRFPGFVCFIFYVPDSPSIMESIENSEPIKWAYKDLIQFARQRTTERCRPLDINNCGLNYSSTTDQNNIGPTNKGSWWWLHPNTTCAIEDGSVVPTTVGAFVFIVGDLLVLDFGVPVRPDYVKFDYLDLTSQSVVSTWQLIAGLGNSTTLVQTITTTGSATVNFNAVDTLTGVKNRYWAIKLSARSSEGTLRRAAIRRVRGAFAR